MLSSCANPGCAESFRYLGEGKLFRLQDEIKGSSSEISNPEYFWLCEHCSHITSLRLTEDGQVIVVYALESQTAAQSALPDFIPLDRRRGLLLSCLRILRPAIPLVMPVPRRRAAYAT